MIETVIIRRQVRVGEKVRFRKIPGGGNLGNQDPSKEYTISSASSPYISPGKTVCVVTQSVAMKERQFVSIGECFTAEYLDLPSVEISIQFLKEVLDFCTQNDFDWISPSMISN